MQLKQLGCLECKLCHYLGKNLYLACKGLASRVHVLLLFIYVLSFKILLSHDHLMMVIVYYNAGSSAGVPSNSAAGHSGFR